MKVLWVKTGFLHPTTKGGQIRTLEILRHLHQWHEIHYAALAAPGEEEGPRRAGEYSTKNYAVLHQPADKRSVKFAGEVARGLVSKIPVAVGRYYSPALERLVGDLIEHERFDRVVCDFLSAVPHIPDLGRAVLFQHNMETVLWRRRAEHASDALARAYLKRQADRMYAYERAACRKAGSIIAVSPQDARVMKELFGVDGAHVIPTGVDVDYFTPRGARAPGAELVFCGSMDWQPNVDGAAYFLKHILPRIRRKRPETTAAIVGRDAPAELQAAAREAGGVLVTGTVEDVRPYLWGAKAAVVPLRIGGGTRLKIYEAMAARAPVVSTRVGAEGLEVNHPENIRLADDPEGFAEQCLLLLESEAERGRLAEAGWRLVSSKFTSERVARRFEEIIRSGPPAY
jgi:glycosyltransferase involved in cell wall biosynthesis